MTALEYMKRQVANNKRNLIVNSRRSGVTEEEINNIKLKIGYYEEAVRVLEKEENV